MNQISSPISKSIFRITPLTYTCIVIGLIILGFQMLVVNRFAGLGGEVTSLRSRSTKIELENMEIKSQILSRQSISTILRQSGELGLVSAKTIFEKPYSQVAKAYGGL